MSDDPPPSPLRDLDERLKQLRDQVEPVVPKTGEPTTGLGVAFTATTYLVTGIAVGAGLGWVLDAWLGTSPGLFVVFFFLGAASGILNVYRMSKGMGMALGYRPAGDDAAAAPGKNKEPTTGRREEGR
ncbi:MAG TPA: AtpZ/AtpI family protein [Rhodospirillales bacterium]|nr:AtpZ/AtpI family protein [Rhodospirillales bacterium]